MLILKEDMPRSLHACLDEILEILTAINGPAGTESRRKAGELHARLHFGQIREIFAQGLHEYITDFLKRITSLAQEIHARYFIATDRPFASEEKIPEGGLLQTPAISGASPFREGGRQS
jgi:uncharacterized alpha-E superfamily protein